VENTFYKEHIPWRTHSVENTFRGEHVLFSFLFAGENSMRGIEHVLIFFLFAGKNSMRGFPFFPFFFKNKNDLKIGFLKYGRW
jgi:hypothetical protein